MDKMDHLMAEKNKNNKDSQMGQVTLKKIFKKKTFKNFSEIFFAQCLNDFWQTSDGNEQVEYGHSSLPVAPLPVVKTMKKELQKKNNEMLICELSL